jgi:hypothetical protein
LKQLIVDKLKEKEYFWQISLAEFLNNIHPVDPIPAGIANGRCGA